MNYQFHLIMEKFGLKQQIGLSSAVALVAGTVIGSGIFTTPGIVLAQTGSVGASLCVWVASSILTGLFALCSIEVCLLVEESGYTYIFLYRAFPEIFAFLESWTALILLRAGGQTLSALSFSIGKF